MWDNLRDESGTNTFFQEEETPPEEPRQKRRRSSGKFLGMTPAQRFILVLMLCLMTCVLGTFCLLITEKIALPFF